jgi:hypothetical protein
MGRNPTPWLYTPKAIMHWMEDVALGDDWMTHRDDIHPSSPGRHPLHLRRWAFG